MVPKHYKVALFHHCGGGNLGDDATMEAMIRNIKSRWPEATVYGFTMNPADTQFRHGIRSYAIRSQTWSFGQAQTHRRATPLKDRLKAQAHKYPKTLKILAIINTVFRRIPTVLCKEIVFLARSFRILRSFDLFIINGGGQFLDSSGGPWRFVGGPWFFPYTIFKWLVLAKLANVRRIILNVGAGPLVHPLTKLFVAHSFSLAEYISFRDDQSRVLAHQIGFRGSVRVLPDSVYSLPLPTLPATATHTGYCSVVGMSPMAYGDPRLCQRHDPAIYNSFIDKFASFGGWLTAHNHCVKLFCSDIGIDPPAADDVEKILRSSARDFDRSSDQVHRMHQWTTAELLRNMSSTDYIVTCRFHGVVLAHLLNIPVIAISHHPKMTSLMEELGLAKYCVDIRSLDVAMLADTFMALMENRCEIKDRMAQRLASYKERLTAQFDELFPRTWSEAGTFIADGIHLITGWINN
jgi:polysaccharide pyruvyl transferase WcaK-like protein